MRRGSARLALIARSARTIEILRKKKEKKKVRYRLFSPVSTLIFRKRKNRYRCDMVFIVSRGRGEIPRSLVADSRKRCAFDELTPRRIVHFGPKCACSKIPVAQIQVRAARERSILSRSLFALWPWRYLQQTKFYRVTTNVSCIVETWGLNWGWIFNSISRSDLRAIKFELKRKLESNLMSYKPILTFFKWSIFVFFRSSALTETSWR